MAAAAGVVGVVHQSLADPAGGDSIAECIGQHAVGCYAAARNLCDELPQFGRKVEIEERVKRIGMHRLIVGLKEAVSRVGC